MDIDIDRADLTRLDSNRADVALPDADRNDPFDTLVARRTIIRGQLVEQALPTRREKQLLLLLHRKEQFFAMLLHELRNPLSTIAHASELLARCADDPRGVSNARGVIQRQLRQLTRLVDDLQDVSRIARGDIELHKQPIDVADVIAGAVETARPLIDRRRHELTVCAPAAPLVIHADPLRLGQVVTNLLVNAAKYTNPGGRLSIVAERTPHAAIVRVRDNGIGISRELLPRVFDLFAQAAPRSPAAMGGMGVGLALARQFVHLHGGSISATSDGPDRGSEFVVCLPLTAYGPAAQ